MTRDHLHSANSLQLKEPSRLTDSTVEYSTSLMKDIDHSWLGFHSLAILISTRSPNSQGSRTLCFPEVAMC